MTPREILLGAAEYIEQHGWTQLAPGAEFGGPNSQCAGNAICDAGGGYPNPDLDKAVEIFVEVAASRALAKRPLVCIHRWNDTPGRTVDEVLAALRAAAERPEAQS